jgi:hypothetical protein
LGIVTGSCHEYETDVIGFALLGTTERKDDTDRRSDSEGRHHQLLRHRALLLQQLLEPGPANLQRQIVSHALGPMPGNCVGDLVREHDGEPAVISSDREDAAVDRDFATWKTERVDRLRTIEQHELPVEARSLRDG